MVKTATKITTYPFHSAYFDMGRVVPVGFMHAIYINLLKALIKMWREEFKGLDASTGNYIIPQDRDQEHSCDQCRISTATSTTSRLEDSVFWMTWLVPYLLVRRYGARVKQNATTPAALFQSRRILYISFTAKCLIPK